jgi:hypothetical protein
MARPIKTQIFSSFVLVRYGAVEDVFRLTTTSKVVWFSLLA